MIWVWILVASAIVIGFHAALKIIGHGEGNIAESLHLVRRFQHFSTGMLFIAIYYFVDQTQARWLISIPTIGFIIFDFCRRKAFPRLNEWFISHWEWLLRPHEQWDSPPAALFFLAGVMVTVFLTEQRDIVILSILNVSICDPAASIIGILVGGPRITSKKSISGSLGAATCGTIAALIYHFISGVEINFLLAFVIALLSEVITIPYLDDNFTIPVFTCSLWMASKAIFY